MKRGYVVISQKEHANLLNVSKRSTSSPEHELTAEELQIRAESMGLHLLSDRDYNAIQPKTSDSPEQVNGDYLKNSAQKLGLSVVPTHEYESLVKLREDKKDTGGTIQIPVTVYNELASRREQPEITKDSLNSYAYRFGLATIPLSEYDTFKNTQNITNQQLGKSESYTREPRHITKDIMSVAEVKEDEDTQRESDGALTPTRNIHPHSYEMGTPSMKTHYNLILSTLPTTVLFPAVDFLLCLNLELHCYRPLLQSVLHQWLIITHNLRLLPLPIPTLLLV